MAAQQAGFRHVLNVEGHGGQRIGCTGCSSRRCSSSRRTCRRDCGTRACYAGVTHLAVDSNLRNVSEAVRYERAPGRGARDGGGGERGDGGGDVGGGDPRLCARSPRRVRKAAPRAVDAPLPRATPRRLSLCAHRRARRRRPEDGTLATGHEGAFLGPASGKEHATPYAAAVEPKSRGFAQTRYCINLGPLAPCSASWRRTIRPSSGPNPRFHRAPTKSSTHSERARTGPTDRCA